MEIVKLPRIYLGCKDRSESAHILMDIAEWIEEQENYSNVKITVHSVTIAEELEITYSIDISNCSAGEYYDHFDKWLENVINSLSFKLIL